MTSAPSRPLTWLVTGSGSGIGLVLTGYILSQGHKVIATSPNPAQTPHLVAEINAHPNGKWLQLDVSSSLDDIRLALASVWSLMSEGIDVIVNSADFSVLGATEDIPEYQAKEEFETNFWGVLRMVKAVTPSMRRRGSGTLVNVSSALGLTVWPGMGIYAASKWALEGVSQALSQELSPFGIRVLLVELGAFKTNAFDRKLQTVKPTPSYASPHPVGLSLEEEERKNVDQPGDLRKAARRIFEVVTGTGDGAEQTHHLRLPLGQDSWEAYGQQAQAVRTDFDAFKDVAFSVGFD